MTIQPKGQDTVDAIVEWSKDEIKKGPADLYDFGKFCFSASTATLGGVVAIAKLGDGFKVTVLFAGSVVLFLATVIIAVVMVQPRVWKLRGSTDLFVEHERKILQGVRYVWVWFSLWLLATIIAVLAVLHVSLAWLPPWLRTILDSSVGSATGG